MQQLSHPGTISPYVFCYVELTSCCGPQQTATIILSPSSPVHDLLRDCALPAECTLLKKTRMTAPAGLSACLVPSAAENFNAHANAGTPARYESA